MDSYRSYLTLMGDIGSRLEQLSELARKKTDAVRKDDLMALNEIIKQEQAIALALRGLEQKRMKLSSELNLDGIRLSQLSEKFPTELQLEARTAADALHRQYKVYEASAHVARNTLECNLHEIEKIIEELGGDPNAEPGYQLSDVQPPQSMKTDFRA